jgi:hypothetical protein
MPNAILKTLPLTKNVPTSLLCHKPLYFEWLFFLDRGLLVPFDQKLVSAAVFHFYLQGLDKTIGSYGELRVSQGFYNAY